MSVFVCVGLWEGAQRVCVCVCDCVGLCVFVCLCVWGFWRGHSVCVCVCVCLCVCGHVNGGSRSLRMELQGVCGP